MTVLELPVFYTVEQIMEMMQWKRSTAYDHARKAVGRKHGARGSLRVPKALWDRYVTRLNTCGSTEEDTSGGAGSSIETAINAGSARVVSIERPRAREPSRSSGKPSIPYTRAGKPRNSKTR